MGKTYMSSEKASVVKKLRSIVHLCQSSDIPHSRAYPLAGSSEMGGIIWSSEWTNLARYVIRTSFFQERMTYLPEESKAIYESKGGNREKVFEALEWLAAMSACVCPHPDRCSHVPDRGEQMVR
jgi:hypothetical protein